jgi:carbon-monoxide dehydrogenase large subunit
MNQTVTPALLPQAEQDRIRRVTGQGRYTADECHADVAMAAFLRSPHAHALIRSIDTSAAAAMPGVLGVFTGADCVAAGLGNFPVIDRIGKGLIIPHRPVMASDRVRHVGEAVAMVVAETQAQAMDAVEAIFVDFDMLPATIGLDAAEAEGAELVHAGTPGNLALRHSVGDAAEVEAAFAAAAHVVRTSIEMPRLAPVTLEPRAALGRWDAAEGRFEIRVPHQGVNEIRRDLASVFGLPPDRFHVLGGDVGGGFGPRNIAYPEYAAVLLAARALGLSVAWHGSRTESFLTDCQGRGVRVSGRLGLDAEGRFVALSMDYAADLGAYITPVAVFAAIHNPLQSLIGCYTIPRAYAELCLLHTHAVTTGPYRGAGRPEMALLIERLVDVAAREIGADPLELRARNAIPRDAFPYTLPNGPRYDSADFLAQIDAARARADWTGFAARREAARSRGLILGRGAALFIEVSGGGGAPDESTLTLSAEAGQPRLVIETVTASTGQSHARTFAAIAAPRLGLAETHAMLVASDPNTRLSGAGSYASRSTIAAGSAVAQAADMIADQLRRLAALRANCAADELTLCDAAVFRADGTLVCTIAALLDTPLQATGKVMPTNAFASGCHVVEVEVDPATGVSRLVRYVAVDDAGVTIDHQAAEAQIHGGIAQGVGEVLTEESTIDKESGQMLAASLMDYTLPRADNLPSYQLVACDTPSPFNPLGVKGIGEAGTTGALCAVTSAIYDALGGQELPAMPYTPLRVWQALHATRR